MNEQIENNVIPTNWLNSLSQDYDFKIIDSIHIVLSSHTTDPFSDSISLMVSKVGTQYIVSDQGYTLWNLESRGITILKKSSNTDITSSVIKKNDIDLSDDIISKSGSIEQVPELVYELTHAILKIDSLLSKS